MDERCSHFLLNSDSTHCDSGGYSDGGFPILHGYGTFFNFCVADAISLFSSVAAIFMFLSILTASARYAEDDFLYALP
ncbi:hypothetical protein Patl1_12178 [Pistacia atlantica]|uniref:Uncharacterized protein n=1 Tax=Pistacia atlantica TaxID=434234 RepID=A0ACC1A6S4_9ROSI|nr:hypothetical protein Patl1_12178 [Pistacia atlantica]